MTSNLSSIQDFEGEFPDWIEIYNNTDDSINLEGWFLSDKESDLSKWSFPEIEISSGEYIIVFASGKDLTDELHTNFKIKKEGEAVFLSSPNIVKIHTFPKACIPDDKSAVWDSNTLRFYYSSNPSPGTLGFSDYTIPINDVLVVNKPSGHYSSSFELEIESENNLDFRYTQDGSVPKSNSSVWSNSIEVNMGVLTENSLSFIPTASSWEEPLLDLPKATVIRAQSFFYNCRISNPITEIYFVGEEFSSHHNAKVISLYVDPEDFFSDSIGIFVEGDNENYVLSGDEGERKGKLQVFDENYNKIIDQDVEVENKGFGTRYRPQKSMRFRAVQKYGEAYFNAPLFSGREEQQYKAFNLRSGMSSFTHSVIADVVAESLVQELNIDYQESELATLYVNGEYWGVFDMRENLDKHYLAQYYQVDKDEVTILRNNALIIEGDKQGYLDLLAFVKNNDIAIEENYNYVISKIDIQNYIQINLLELYLANWDWPHNNVKYWKSNEVESKFRWFFFDCDACLYKQSFASVDMFSNPLNHEWDRVLLSKLFTNARFRNDFTLTYFSMVSGTLGPGNVIAKIDSIEAIYSPLILNQIKRWHIPSSFDHWNESVSEMRDFALDRPQSLLSDIQSQFGNPISFYPNPAKEVLFLSLPEGMENVTINIFDVLGNKVLYLSSYSSEGINVQSLEVGMYTISVQIGGVQFSDRFLKV